MLRRSLQESMRRMSALASEGSAQVDRRIVVKLLTTYFEKGHSAEVLQVMARMLGFTGGYLCDAPALELLLLSVRSLAFLGAHHSPACTCLHPKGTVEPPGTCQYNCFVMRSLADMLTLCLTVPILTHVLALSCRGRQLRHRALPASE